MEKESGLQKLLEMGIDALINPVDTALTTAGANDAVHGLIIDGIYNDADSVLLLSD